MDIEKKQASSKNEKKNNAGMDVICQHIQDPRKNRITKYSLAEILFVAIVGVLCGASDYTEMAYFAARRRDWFCKYFPYNSPEPDMPSASTLQNLLSRIDPAQLHKAFVQWMMTSIETLKDIGTLQLAVDGKTVRGSRTANERPLHIVSAFATAAKVVLAQVTCDKKSNEITAIPELLKMFDLHGALISIDAGGTYTVIAETIIDNGADYLLVVKKNQKMLYAAIEDCFGIMDSTATEDCAWDYYVTEEKKHGRSEKRECYVIHGREWMGGTAQTWKDVKLAALIRSTVTKGAKQTITDQYLICSREGMTAKEVLEAKRSHWAVEAFHWILDVQFGDDASRAHADKSAENLSLMRRMAQNILRRVPELKRLSFRHRQTHCWEEDDARSAAVRAMLDMDLNV